MKFILHCDNPDNLTILAKAAKYCATKEMDEGYWGLIEYTHPNGRVDRVSYVKRKSCVTLFEQPRMGGA